MSLNEKIKQDFLRISTNTSDFGLDITLTRNGEDPVIFQGIFNKHHSGFDIDGVRVSSKQSSVSISELLFISLDYTYRNADGEVDLRDVVVSFVDSSGSTKEGVVREVFPDEKLGMIVLILGDYE